jgi:NAD(P)-dependent dehydrogenase (short-subunit alcohol dehydrogenase family)
MTLADKRAVVTGGTRGIGAAVARALREAGAEVIVTGRTPPAEERESNFIAFDVRDEAQVKSAFAAIEKGGGVDILVNNAGAAASAPFDRHTSDTFKAMLDVHLLGAVYCIQAALPSMRTRPYGRIVNVASTAGLKGYPYVSAYCAAKHALIGLTRSLALELARTAITVNAVCPGYTCTELIDEAIETIQRKTGRSHDEALAQLTAVNPQGRLVEPEEVAHAALWLCQPEARSITGQSLVVAGGELP